MSSQPYEQFFLQPNDPVHRRYEALRAVFVDPNVAKTMRIIIPVEQEALSMLTTSTARRVR